MLLLKRLFPRPPVDCCSFDDELFVWITSLLLLAACLLLSSCSQAGFFVSDLDPELPISDFDDDSLRLDRSPWPNSMVELVMLPVPDPAEFPEL